MKTKILRLDEEHIDQEAMAEAGRVICAGGLVAFPTETVYGLGGDALNADSSGKIYAAKGRPSDNPLIVHIADMDGLKEVAAKVPEAALRLAERFWPGPLTMIFKKADCVPYATTGGLDTVAVRMPSNKIARELIRTSGRYIAAPSANLSGKPSPTDAKHVIQDLYGRVDIILDGGESDIGLESTIIDLSGEMPVILRPGYITEEMLGEIITGIDTDKNILDANADIAPKAPGMKYRHYAPKGNLVVVEGGQEQVTAYINGRLREHKAEGKRTGVIATDETAAGYRADSVKSAGRRDDECAIAKHLFRILREFDDEEIQMIYAEAFDSTGVGYAIMNRLLKAAGHQVITL